MTLTLEMWVGISGLLFGVALQIIIVTRFLSKMEASLIKTVNDAKDILKKEWDHENDTLRHELAETLKPIQTHISRYEEKHYKLELYIRDKYIEVTTFQQALGEIKELINELKEQSETIRKETNIWREKYSIAR